MDFVLRITGRQFYVIDNCWTSRPPPGPYVCRKCTSNELSGTPWLNLSSKRRLTKKSGQLLDTIVQQVPLGPYCNRQSTVSKNNGTRTLKLICNFVTFPKKHPHSASFITICCSRFQNPRYARAYYHDVVITSRLIRLSLFFTLSILCLISYRRCPQSERFFVDKQTQHLFVRDIFGTHDGCWKICSILCLISYRRCPLSELFFVDKQMQHLFVQDLFDTYDGCWKICFILCLIFLLQKGYFYKTIVATPSNLRIDNDRWRKLLACGSSATCLRVFSDKVNDHNAAGLSIRVREIMLLFSGLLLHPSDGVW